MKRNLIFFLIFFAFCTVIIARCNAASAQVREASSSVEHKSVYRVYAQVGADDYLPDEPKYTAAHYDRPRVKKAPASKPVMNIPVSFGILFMTFLLVLLIYVVGLMLQDMTQEDPVDVEGTVGNLDD